MGEPANANAADTALRIVYGGASVVALVVEVSGRDTITIHGRLDELLRLTVDATSRLSQLSQDLPHLRMAPGAGPPPWSVPKSS